MAALRHQQAYDHRVRLKVFQGERDITHSQQESIPRSTISTWKARPPKQVVTLACAPMTSAEMERDSLLIENQRLKTKLAAMRSLAMLLWTVLRFSGFTFEAKRLPSGADKKRLLRAVKRAGEFYRLSSLLSRIGL